MERPVTASSPARKSPVGKNRVLVTSAVAPAPAAELETERPSMARLGMVLALCFALGVAWPIAGGLEFVQRPPGSSAAKPVEVEGPSDGEPSAVGDPELPAMRAAPLAVGGAAPGVESRRVESCEGDSGEAVARCDAPDVSRALEEPLAKLGACGRAVGASGVLSLGTRLDFARGQITEVKAGQSSTLPPRQRAQLLACAEEHVVGTPLDEIEHSHARYWVYLGLRLPGRGELAEPAAASSELVSASGQATVGWKTAIVREEPSTQARVATRLAYGTRVSVTGRAGDWYRIERSRQALGWVHRDALGL